MEQKEALAVAIVSQFPCTKDKLPGAEGHVSLKKKKGSIASCIHLEYEGVSAFYVHILHGNMNINKSSCVVDPCELGIQRRSMGQ